MPAQSLPLLNRRRVLVLLGAVLVWVVGWYAASYPRGMLMAYIDHARGVYAVKTYGYPVEWIGEYRHLLQEKYGVELDPIAGCMVTEDEVWYASGYNSVSRRLLVRKFGKDIFVECRSLAKQVWEAKQNDPGDDLVQ